jgi:hypothetical protein
LPRGPRRATPNSVRRGGGEGINARSAGGGGRAGTGHRPTDMFLYPPRCHARTTGSPPRTLCLALSRPDRETSEYSSVREEPAALMKRNTNKGIRWTGSMQIVRLYRIQGSPIRQASMQNGEGSIDVLSSRIGYMGRWIEGQVPPAGAGARRRQQRLTRPLGYS